MVAFNPSCIARLLIALTILLFAPLAAFSTTDTTGSNASPDTQPSSPSIPTLDQMAGDWIPMSIVASPPAVHNFNGMFIVDRDLTSFSNNPAEPYPTRHAYPTIKLLIDGQEYPATDTRWFAYRALRRNPNCNGLSIETDTRMVLEQRSVLCRINASNSGAKAIKATLSLHVPGTLRPDNTGVSNNTQHRGFTSVVRPSTKPASVTKDKDGVAWNFEVDLNPGDKATFGFVAGDGLTEAEQTTNTNIASLASGFDAAMDNCRILWEKRWTDAFTPGNSHFSGSLPVLSTNDPALSRNYYMGVLTMLILERTQFPVSPRSFITSGERADGIQYYWDASMQATPWAMLEPEGMKASLRRWLVQNPRSGVQIMVTQTKGFDPVKYDTITGYAFNACTIFKTADEYLRLTGDHAFLDERLEDGKTVLDHMDELATDWETLPKGPHGLVNYGKNRNLLECAPAYINCVASLNAQDVWMMRQMAVWHAVHGETARANELLQKAAALLPAVLSLYKSGDGVWNSYHEDGSLVELRHCVDYIYVGNALRDDLSQGQKSEMNAFVKRELFMRDWMRAMSLKDAAAARSDRPDHGPMGAYDGWIPLTVGAMWRLGDPIDAFNFFDRTDVVTKEGPYAQAREFYGLGKENFDAPVRVALRRGCMKECISGAAFADVVINTFFGFSPSPSGDTIISDRQTPRPFKGTLWDVRFGGKLLQLIASPDGIKTSF